MLVSICNIWLVIPAPPHFPDADSVPFAVIIVAYEFSLFSFFV